MRFRATARGSYYHVIIRKHDYGQYLSITGIQDLNWPIMRIRSETRTLSKHLKIADALTAVNAIREIKSLL